MTVTDSLDADTIIAKIADGATQREIAEEFGLSASRLNEWLHADPERSARAREAMEISAEAWLDRGLDALTAAEPEAVEIARARAIEQHCARRAAIRNPRRYGDKLAVGGADDLPPIRTSEERNRRIEALLAKRNADRS